MNTQLSQTFLRLSKYFQFSLLVLLALWAAIGGYHTFIRSAPSDTQNIPPKFFDYAAQILIASALPVIVGIFSTKSALKNVAAGRSEDAILGFSTASFAVIPFAAIIPFANVALGRLDCGNACSVTIMSYNYGLILSAIVAVVWITAAVSIKNYLHKQLKISQPSPSRPWSKSKPKPWRRVTRSNESIRKAQIPVVWCFDRYRRHNTSLRSILFRKIYR